MRNDDNEKPPLATQAWVEEQRAQHEASREWVEEQMKRRLEALDHVPDWVVFTETMSDRFVRAANQWMRRQEVDVNHVLLLSIDETNRRLVELTRVLKRIERNGIGGR